MKSFAERLRELRGETTRAEIAERSGISESYLAHLENGRYPNPTSETMFKLAAALGVGCDVFASCDFSGEKKPAAGKRGRPKGKAS